MKLFVNGEVADEFVGAPPEREIRRFLEKALPSPNARQLAEAQRFLTKGANARAAELLEPLVNSDPGNAEARVLLAQAHLSSAPERMPALLEPVPPESEAGEKATGLRMLARLAQLAREPGASPEGRVRERYLAGAAAVCRGDFASALEAFIDVLERNKEYDNACAKAACRAIFQLLGPWHPLAERFFRAFSSALHS